MSETSATRRDVLATSAAAGAVSLLTPGPARAADDRNEGAAILPFSVHFPEAALVELHRRISATIWPERETVADDSQGVQLATMQQLARYWATDHDWRKCEAKLNALPQFITRIDGLDIHFIHVRSKHDNALPLIVTHGWPGSIIEQLKIIGPLTNPTAHGASASDAFHLVIPSLPGYGFSGKPAAPGWNHLREVDVDAEQPCGPLARHRGRDRGAPVAALGDVARISESLHQHRPRAGDAVGVPAGGGGLARKPVTR